MNDKTSFSEANSLRPIDIEKLAKEYGLTEFVYGTEYVSDSLVNFAEAYAAKVMEDKEREIERWKLIASDQKMLIEGLKGECKNMGTTDICIALARKDTANKELQAHINDLREALERLSNDRKLWKVSAIGGQDSYAGMPPAIRIIDEALAETPAQSLQEHDNEVIEMCAEELEERGCRFESEVIRALKGGKWQS